MRRFYAAGLSVGALEIRPAMILFQFMLSPADHISAHSEQK